MSKTILKLQNNKVTLITRDQLVEEIHPVITEGIEEEQHQRLIDDELNLVDTGYLIQLQGVSYGSREIIPGNLYLPNTMALIALARKQGVIE